MQRPHPGTVVRIDLPSGPAYGRVLRDASIAIYRLNGDLSSPPIGSRDYEFVVGIYDTDLRRLPVVGFDQPTDGDDWPPPVAIRPNLPGDSWRIYERGEIRPATSEQAGGLEAAAVWSIDQIADRLSRDIERR